MTRFLRISILVAAVAAIGATGALANVPDAGLSTTPEVITATPDGSIAYTVTVIGTNNTPVSGAVVEVFVGALTFPLWSQCVGQLATPSGVDGILIGTTNASGTGQATFFFEGGGCVQVGGGDFVAKVKADGIPFGEPTLNSPDITNSGGERPDENGENTCAPQGGGGVATVGLSDGTEHTGAISGGLVDICSNMTGPNFEDPVGLPDAVILSTYIVEGTTCTCVN